MGVVTELLLRISGCGDGHGGRVPPCHHPHHHHHHHHHRRRHIRHRSPRMMPTSNQGEKNRGTRVLEPGYEGIRAGVRGV